MSERICLITGKVCNNDCQRQFCIFQDSIGPYLERANFLKQAILKTDDPQKVAESSFFGLVSWDEIRTGAKRSGVSMLEFTKVLLKKYQDELSKP